MKIADRLALAAQCRDIAEAHGAEVEVLPRGILGDERQTHVRVKFSELQASFEIGGCLAPGVLVHFHHAERDLRHALVFDSINEYHKRKATTWNADGGAVFLRWWAATCAEIAAGAVFA